MAFAVRSDIGLRRANNQDSCTVVLADNQADFEQRGHFFMVADGMGAHAAGELASKMATDAVAMVYRKRLAQSPADALLSALQDANGQIHSRGQASPDFRGMGTTATTMVLLSAGVMVAHVGDSRAYRLHGIQLDQLTFDHSLVWELRAASQMAHTELPNHISKNIITRSLGPNESVQIDLEGPYPAEPGDTFLLCSDGLSGQVQDDEIGLILSLFPPEEAAQSLVDLANLRGGPDNITTVVARVLDAQVARATDDDSSNQTTSAATRSIPPIVWTTAVATFLVGAGLLFFGHLLLGLVGLLISIGTFFTAIAQRYSDSGGEPSVPQDEHHWGRGPYVRAECLSPGELPSRLNDSLQRLREGPLKECKTFDWSQADEILARAEAAMQAAHPAEAAREYLHAVSALMAQLRQFRQGK